MKRIFLTAAALIAIAIVGAVLFAWSGLYSIAADKGHFAIVRWFLEFGMRNSVETHAIPIDAPPLDDPALILRGAGHYQGGCAPCHGAPGERQNPIVRAMLPPPPFLPEHIREWSDPQLFWIVKHGIKYAGMPSWVAPERDDEVWAVTAFLRRLPSLDARGYRELAFGEAASEAERLEERERVLALVGPLGNGIAACARCHGLDGAGRGAGAFPRLTGQTEAYLHEALRSYASGARPSGIMQPVATELDEDAMRALARYYAAIEPPAPAAATDRADRRLLDAGRALAEAGAPADGVPPCASCHGPGGGPRNPLYPALAGQYASYLELQLRLWKDGKRGGGAYSAIMAPVAQAMSEAQIRAVSLYYASLAQQEGR